MKGWFLQFACVVASSLVLASCGQPGAPIAPSLEFPRAAEGVSAIRKGDKVTVRWTPPTRFTDGRIIRKVGATNVCRAAGDVPAAKCEAVAKVPAKGENTNGAVGERAPVEYEDVLPQAVLQSSPTGSVMYGVEVQNTHGRSVGISDQVKISTAPALAPPAQLTATLGADGVTLAWEPIAAPSASGLRFAYQVSRRTEGGEYTAIASVPLTDSKYLDQTMEWEKKVEYRIDVATHDAKQTLVEGEDSEPVSVETHDVFPPAQPRELQAVFSGPGQQAFIDLSWAPNVEQDLAGYNVYRQEEGGTAVKLNAQLVTAPAFRDEHVASGKKYVYSISAVDLRGNESPRSSEASESVP
jgi:hypothetical protein